MRSATNWGHGDFSDLAALLTLASKIGAAGIGLNPLHALFPQRPAQASPYSPSSRLFLNVLYLDAQAVPGFDRCAVTVEDSAWGRRAGPIVMESRIVPPTP